jgi:putative SOS response-associated peptidase YedK
VVAGRKQPWYFAPIDAELFGLAGITSFWNGVRSVSLITTAPNRLMESIHERMPVIVAPEDYAAWLDPAEHDADELMRFVRAYPAERMEGWPVSMRVNQPANDGPALLERVAPRQSSLL